MLGFSGQNRPRWFIILLFKFAGANKMFSLPTSLYDEPDYRRRAVSALRNSHQCKKTLFRFIPVLTRLINNFGCTDDQAKIDLLSGQAFWWNESAFDWTRYAGPLLGLISLGLHKLGIDVRAAGQRKKKIANNVLIKPCCSGKSKKS